MESPKAACVAWEKESCELAQAYLAFRGTSRRIQGEERWKAKMTTDEGWSVRSQPAVLCPGGAANSGVRSPLAQERWVQKNRDALSLVPVDEVQL